MGKMSDAIKKAIKASEQTPYGIAKGTGIARSQVSRFLSDKRTLNAETIEKLADYLGLKITIEPDTKKKRK